MSLHWYDMFTWLDVLFALFVVLTCLMCGIVGALFVLTWSDRKRDGTEEYKG
jgi:hypothetical protein